MHCKELKFPALSHVKSVNLAMYSQPEKSYKKALLFIVIREMRKEQQKLIYLKNVPVFPSAHLNC